MKLTKWSVAVLTLVVVSTAPPPLHAQLWTGILSASRAYDWNAYPAGVKNGIPSGSWTQCGTTIAAYTGTAATINTAITNCGTNQYVQLGSGTFTLSTAITMNKPNVALRGMGANKTFIVGSATAGCGFSANAIINFCVAFGTVQSVNTWTAGYAQGSTLLTLTTDPGLVIGSMIFLDQADDATDGYPAAGDTYICQVSSATCAAGSGGGVDSRAGRAQTEVHEVTNITGTGPFTVTITPPLSHVNWRSGQTPGAYWMTPNSDVLVNAGVEELSIDWSAVQSTASNAAIAFGFAKDCWAKGVRIIDTSSTLETLSNPVFFSRDMRVTIQDSYIFGPSINPTSVFQIPMANSGSILIQNNIIQQGNQPIWSIGSLSNSVIAYNFVVGTPGNTGSPGAFGTHGAGEMYDLMEGNYGPQFVSDSIHGTHDFQTQYRNYLTGMGPTVFARQPYYEESYARFTNSIANVLGNTASSFSAYESNVAYNNDSIYNLGWSAPPGSGEVQVNTDGRVKATMMRWGNWNSVTYNNGATTGIRWCGNSSDTNWSTICGSTSEVPTGITNFSNPVPTKGDTGIGQGALPASFYLSSKPSWWVFNNGNPLTPWPGIGPDVTGGNVTGTAGHANLIPAANCYLNVMNGAPDGSGTPSTFNDTSCYTPSIVPSSTPCAVTTVYRNWQCVQLASATSVGASSGAQSVAYNIPAAPQDGIIVFTFYCQDAACTTNPGTTASISDNIGCAWIASPPQTTSNGGLFNSFSAWVCPSAPDGLTTPSVTCSATCYYQQTVAVEFTGNFVPGNLVASVVDQISSSAGSGTSSSLTTSSTTGYNDLSLAFVVVNGSASGVQTIAPYFNLGTLANATSLLQAVSTSSPAPQTATASWTGSTNWSGIIISVRPAKALTLVGGASLIGGVTTDRSAVGPSSVWQHLNSQPTNNTIASGTSISVVMPSAPLTNDLVICVWDMGGVVSNFAVQDGNLNAYTVTGDSPISAPSGVFYLTYLLKAPSLSSSGITATWTGSTSAHAFCDEFRDLNGSQSYDKDATALGQNTGATASINLPSLTPATTGELLYGIATDTTIVSPAAGGDVLGFWTGSDAISGRFISTEYDVAVNGSQASQYNVANTGSNYDSIIMAFAP